MKKKNKNTNKLIHESSPYLLQHAHNPVNWKAWNQESLDLAREEKKLLLISVGYSACHWCHVMEEESFEDQEVAAIMNKSYICIKVDREERPDVDQVYMEAVQVMTGMGGWPMNVVALPDGRPVWGGTYFKKEQWKSALQQISRLYQKQPKKLEEYARKLEEGLNKLQIIETDDRNFDFNVAFIDKVVEKWKNQFDHKNGGLKGAPKFMMPNNYEFLLRYGWQNSNNEILDYCFHTLDRISQGGVFDLIEGGFSRYSVDEKWHIPHFEKMLYDNAQLVSLYSRAYRLKENPWYREVVEKSLDFISKNMTHESGAFYSALDADSENIEGKKEEGAYYTWNKKELKHLLGEDFQLFAELYNINNYGKWEADNYVLIRTRSFEDIAREKDISLAELKKTDRRCLDKLKDSRSKRVKPALDDKSLTSWNAMMITAYCEAFISFDRKKYLHAARKNADFILSKQIHGDQELYHNFKEGKGSINAYLEDYAFLIEALIKLYETCFEEAYLNQAMKFCESLEKNFLDSTSGLYNFTSSKDPDLITKTKEISDNVIPASNSVMAKNLFRLGKLTGKVDLVEKAESMLRQISGMLTKHPQYHSNWLDLMMNFSFPFFEIVISGNQAKEKAGKFQTVYMPNTVLSVSKTRSQLPVFKDRFDENKTLIYVCREGTCLLPTASESEAMAQIFQV